MNLQQHNKRDAMKVWLSKQEVNELLEQPDRVEIEIAFGLSARCGLRSQEILDVLPTHVKDTGAGKMLVVPSGKGDKYRETPIDGRLAGQIRTIESMKGSDETVVPVESTAALRKWIKHSRERLAKETDNERWNHVSMHDLRRSWATLLESAGVDSRLVMKWGGWSNIDTYYQHYQGAHSPEAQKRERDKVEWL
jgi:integrase